jgi:hypothetical protein
MNRDRIRRLRASIATVLVALMPLVVVVTAITWGPQLPEVIPRQWSNGEVVAVISAPALLTCALAVGVIGAVVATYNTIRLFRTGRSGSYLGASMAAALPTGLWVSLAGAATTHFAEVGWWWLATVLAAAYAFLAPLIAPAGGSRIVEAAPLSVAPGDTVAWASSFTSPVAMWTTVGVLAVTGTIGVSELVIGGDRIAALAWLGAGLLITIPVAALFARLRVFVDARGVIVRSGVGNITLRHVPLEQVQTARAEWVEPARWGGTGYRVGSKGSALITGSGPVLALGLSDGSEFSVSLRSPADAADAAAVAEGLRARH